MAGAGIATISHENREHIEPETEVGILAGLLDMHRHAHLVFTEGDGQGRITIGERMHCRSLQPRLVGMLDGKRTLACHITGQAVGLSQLHDE